MQVFNRDARALHVFTHFYNEVDPQTPSLQTGDIVTVQEPDTSHLQWSRINSIFPGADGVVRVVEVKNPKGLLRRAYSLQRFFSYHLKKSNECVLLFY